VVLVNSQVPGLNTDESHQGPGGFRHQSTLDLEEPAPPTGAGASFAARRRRPSDQIEAECGP